MAEACVPGARHPRCTAPSDGHRCPAGGLRCVWLTLAVPYARGGERTWSQQRHAEITLPGHDEPG